MMEDVKVWHERIGALYVQKCEEIQGLRAEISRANVRNRQIQDECSRLYRECEQATTREKELVAEIEKQGELKGLLARTQAEIKKLKEQLANRVARVEELERILGQHLDDSLEARKSFEEEIKNKILQMEIEQKVAQDLRVKLAKAEEKILELSSRPPESASLSPLTTQALVSIRANLRRGMKQLETDPETAARAFIAAEKLLEEEIKRAGEKDG